MYVNFILGKEMRESLIPAGGTRCVLRFNSCGGSPLSYLLPMKTFAERLSGQKPELIPHVHKVPVLKSASELAVIILAITMPEIATGSPV